MRSTPMLSASALLLGATRAWGATSVEQAAIQDPTAQCTYAGFPAITAANATGLFPTVWTPVTQLTANDAAGKAKFAAISAGIPKIAPKGKFGAVEPFEGFTYSDTDPDCWWTRSQCVTPKTAGVPPDIATVPEPRTLGYGFDDGPNCSHNAFYDYLTQQNQKATMFFVGSNVIDWPLQAQRAVDDGHEICVHTWSHRPMTTFTNEGAFAELWYTIQAIKLVTGYTPKCWRPPTGDVDDRIRYIANQLGLDNVLWKFDTFDYTTEEPAVVKANYDGLLGNLSAGAFDHVGAIILAHELSNFTMQMAVENYPRLAAAFDHIVPIAVAQNKTNPYTETNVTMPSFAEYIAARPKSGTNSSSGKGNSSGGNSSSGIGGAKGDSAALNLRVPGALVSALALVGGAAFFL
ncbi:carbohydrate esterase family 4 protein [Mycena crocata]|nr:carbohydrate esterase family 4 protein [Mycena crocata]